MTRTGRTHGAAGAVALAAVALVAAGCGGSSANEAARPSTKPSTAGKTPTTAETRQSRAGTPTVAGSTSTAGVGDDLLAFAGCMREHGIDMPDPRPGPAGGGLVRIGEANDSPQALGKANRACRTLLPKGPEPSPKQIEEMAESSLRFARCMREHGVDMPDPKIGADGSVSIAIGGSGAEGPSINPTSPAFQNAQKACAVGGNGVVFGAARPVGGQ